jgi:hypothetical protein
MKVLLVEDDEQTAKSIELMLKSLGHQYHWVTRGEAGAALARRGVYDVILLDVMPSGINGYEVLQKLRSANLQAELYRFPSRLERRPKTERDKEILRYASPPGQRDDGGQACYECLPRERFAHCRGTNPPSAPRTMAKGRSPPNSGTGDGGIAFRLYDLATGDEDARLCRGIPDDQCREQPKSFLCQALAQALSKTSDALSDCKVVLPWGAGRGRRAGVSGRSADAGTRIAGAGAASPRWRCDPAVSLAQGLSGRP